MKLSEINLMDKYPRSKRNIEERASLIKEEHREIARKFEKDFFDGDRLYGYGGYNYHPRFWQETVKRFSEFYKLDKSASILDVGCGKGFMLHDFQEFSSTYTVAGIDVSNYAVENAMDSVKKYLQVGDAKEIPFEDNSFDLVISINTIHNLELEDCKKSIREIERVSKKHSFIVVDAWRNEEEKKRMLGWNLTALTYMHVDDWKQLFNDQDYSGDYYWFIAE